ncbi:RraA family protein [Aquamicrobium sp. LC103]|uniref:RraA family protein n=1 Tax=Aquamicrobium sp. LC103 TaxID=1120658 RepID=UPI00063E9577|nr:RraA family protein [Aquamicrobium sp. LC103]TKT74446.1 RraA family protein [Aquamicrobium sp. LC103]
MIGFRVVEVQRRVSRDLVEQFRELPVANVSDCMSRISSLGPELRPLHGGGTVLAGPAVTVRTRPGDNLMIHKAIDIAEPGDVIVVDAGGDLTNSLIGELMLSHAITRGIAGFVLNGAVRDLGWIKAHDLPVYAAGVTHRGPYKDGPGEVNLPISINGTVIMPGDLILGDEDGVLAVAYDEAESLLPQVAAKHSAEVKQLQAISEGRNKREWVDDTLRQRGCLIG